ncbi:MAG: hypothetical protein KF884_09355 [Fimbriimonadaceae bacterium]|nr:hypothetical protein [Fimbriimonadaceae bacterium]QYK57752.1 MAG: hypothetical protein KF884_09355 [Fimbriimonadaceae bacterium]
MQRSLRPLVSILALATMVGPAWAQIKGVSAVGQKGITETVVQIMNREGATNPFRPYARILKKTESEGTDRSHLKNGPEAPISATWPLNVEPLGLPRTSQGRDGGSNPYLPQTPGVKFDGGTSAGAGIWPPDTFGAVGPTQILVTLNNRIRVYDKAGTLGTLNVLLDTFFNSVRGGAGTSDPRVTFDRTTNRWFVCAITVNSPNRLLLAVSSGPTITNTASFTFYFVNVPSAFADYCSLGVDGKAVIIGENTFNTALTAFLGANVTVIQKSSVLSGGPIFSTRFNVVANSSAQGPFAPRGVDNDDPNPPVSVVVGPDNATFGNVVFRFVSGSDTTSPTISSNTVVGVPATSFPVTVLSGNNATRRLDVIDDRFFHAQISLNRKTGQRYLTASHNIRVNSSGNAGSGQDRNGMRWYEFQNIYATPSLRQAGTAFDPASSGFRDFWMGSCVATGQGHLAIGFNGANPSTRVQVLASGRLAGDPLGQTQAETLIDQTTNNYNDPFSGVQRWGDYSGTFVDPADDQTIWTFQEYIGNTNEWRARVVQLLAPPPSPVASVTPNTIAAGSTVNITINGTATGGSEYYDNDANYPQRLQAAFSGAGLTVNSITFNHSTPQQIVLNVTADGSAAAGPRDLTITNPDRQAVTATAAVTVTSGTGPQTVVPDSLTLQRGQIISGTIADLANDDNVALRIKKFFVANPSEPFVWGTLQGTTSVSNPSSVTFRVKSRMATGGQFEQQIEQFNWNTSSYENTVTTNPFGTTYGTRDSEANPATGKVDGTGRIQARIRVFPRGISASLLPEVDWDLVNWIVTP